MKTPDSAAHVLARYEALVSDLTDLVRGDYRSRLEDIGDAMSRFATDGLLVKAFALEQASGRQSLALTGAHSFALRANDVLMLRLNCWYPRSRLSANGHAEHEKYFSIGVCHNHNFDFFTTCVIGPGYTTDFLVTDEDLSRKGEGDRLSFRQGWSTAVGLGESLFVPRESHFHTQHYPESFSATVNLIPIAGQSESGRQYTLDHDRQTVKRVILAGATPA